MNVKKIMLALVIACAAGAHATETAQPDAVAKGIDKETYCGVIDRLATTAMEYRQKGYSLHDVLENSKAIKSDVMRGLFKKIAITAYSQPAFSGTGLQRKSVVDFAAKIATTCYNSVQEPPTKAKS